MHAVNMEYVYVMFVVFCLLHVVGDLSRMLEVTMIQTTNSNTYEVDNM